MVRHRHVLLYIYIKILSIFSNPCRKDIYFSIDIINIYAI